MKCRFTAKTPLVKQQQRRHTTGTDRQTHARMHARTDARARSCVCVCVCCYLCQGSKDDNNVRVRARVARAYLHGAKHDAVLVPADDGLVVEPERSFNDEEDRLVRVEDVHDKGSVVLAHAPAQHRRLLLGKEDLLPLLAVRLVAVLLSLLVLLWCVRMCVRMCARARMCAYGVSGTKVYEGRV